MSRTESATALGQQIRNTTRALELALREARAFNDPGLSAEGLNKKRAELAQQARDEHTATIAKLERDLVATTNAAVASADAARPVANHDDLTRAWSKVTARLDAGMPLPQILANADQVEALAIREFGPSHLEAAAYKAHGERTGVSGPVNKPDTGALLRAVDARLADVLGDAGAPLREVPEITAIAAGVRPMVAHAGHLAQGTPGVSGLHAAIEGRLAQNAAQSTNYSADAGREPQPAT